MPDRLTPNEPANVSFGCTPVARLPETSSSREAIDPIQTFDCGNSYFAPAAVLMDPLFRYRMLRRFPHEGDPVG
jgi:hypothetical protein